VVRREGRVVGLRPGVWREAALWFWGPGCIGSLRGFDGYIVEGVEVKRHGHSTGTRLQSLMITIRLYVMLIVSSGLRAVCRSGESVLYLPAVDLTIWRRIVAIEAASWLPDRNILSITKTFSNFWIGPRHTNV
jgi:hypothetical protein